MRLPDLVAYQSAVQHPRTAFGDAELRSGTVTAGRFGLPRAVAGNFAVTYQVCSPKSRWAVRCFHRDASDRAQRYAAISDTLNRVRGSALVTVTYLPVGVRVGATWFPVTKMPWLDGLTLNRAVEQRLRQPSGLRDLEQRFVRLVEQLRRHGLAHGDLQHGNILVDPSGELRLVDYDGMYVPALRGSQASERGDPNYQHPARAEQFDAELDRFSVLVIVLALRALAAEPDLWRTYNSDDNLLFRRADFLKPGQSPLFRDLRALPATRELAERLADACTADLARVPLLSPPSVARVPLISRPSLSPSTRPAPLLSSPALSPSAAAAPAASALRAYESVQVAVLNRLYGTPTAPARAKQPRQKRASRSWRVRRTTPQVAIAFSADGNTLITADITGAVRLRDAIGGRTLQTIRQPLRLAALACGKTPSGARGHLTGLTDTGALVHLPLAKNQPTNQVWSTPSPGSAPVLALASNAGWVASGNAAGTLRCWSVPGGKLVGAARQRGGVHALAVAASGTLLASAGVGLGIHLWALPGGRALRTLVTAEPVEQLAFSRDGRLLAGALRPGGVLVWDVVSSELVRELKPLPRDLTGLAFAPGNDALAFTAADGTVGVCALPRAVAPALPGAVVAGDWLRSLIQRLPWATHMRPA